MFKKKNSIYLILFFVILLLIVIGIEYFGKKEKLTSLPQTLIHGDVETVDEFWIIHEFREENKLRIFKTLSGDWALDAGDGRPCDIREDVLKSSLDHLKRLKPDALAASSADRWPEFKVDSNGTLLRVFSEGELLASLVLGRLDFKEQAISVTYVRPEVGEQTYAVDLYLEASLKADDHHWRSFELISGDPEQWKQIYIDYGNDGGYTLYNTEGEWHLGDLLIESTLMDDFLKDFKSLVHNEFVVQLYSEDLYRPVLRADFIRKDGTTTSLNVYNTEFGRVITSTANRGNVMIATKEIIDAIYYPRIYFLGGIL